MKRSRLIGLVLYLVVFVLLWQAPRLPLPGVAVGVARLLAVCMGLLLAFWLLRIAWRKLLWRVGRRLTFTYLLVGTLPFLIFALLGVVSAYIAGGFLLGHLYRDAAADVTAELAVSARTRLGDSPRGRTPEWIGEGAIKIAEYSEGRKSSGSAEAPDRFPGWLEPRDEDVARRARLVALSDGSLALAAAARSGDRGAVAWIATDLESTLRSRAGAWVQLIREDDPRNFSETKIQVLNQSFKFRGLWLKRTEEEEREYYRVSPARGRHPTRWEKPFVVWMELAEEPLRRLQDGSIASEAVTASLASSPAALWRAILPSSTEVDAAAWFVLAGLGLLLFEVYLVAAVLAAFMIFGVSRAVNRLYVATQKVARGDFSHHIRVRRKDQLGELQRSFNGMSGHLGELVASKALKEAIDKELALARRVQQDLLPRDLGSRPGLDLAFHFEPSAAIGGDYFDLFDTRTGGIAIVVADVAGHGLPAGLRMAMIKSALTLLVEDGTTSVGILARLKRLLAPKPGERSMVTATLAFFDPATGELELTNAGHPPTYLVRVDGRVEEILLPSSPLGTLVGEPRRSLERLARGDAAVWLSDGIIESQNEAEEMFGYERVARALAGSPDTAAAIRDRLLAEVRRHAGGEAPEDDQTAVVLLYRPTVEAVEVEDDVGTPRNP